MVHFFFHNCLVICTNVPRVIQLIKNHIKKMSNLDLLKFDSNSHTFTGSEDFIMMVVYNVLVLYL